MEKHEEIHLYLDQDSAGRLDTEQALKWDKKYIDKSDLYNNYKDLNEYLKSPHLKINQGLKVRRLF